METGKEAAERIRQEYEDKQRQLTEAANRQAQLQAGIPSAWKALKDALQRELEDFRNHSRLSVDDLLWDVHDNKLLIIKRGLSVLTITFADGVVTSSVSGHHTFRFNTIGQISLSNYGITQDARELLGPLFRSFE